jgi:hypothetical protein
MHTFTRLRLATAATAAVAIVPVAVGTPVAAAQRDAAPAVAGPNTLLDPVVSLLLSTMSLR